MLASPDFDSIRRQNILGHDYWSARELMPLLGYGNKWQNFEKVVEKAIEACEIAEQDASMHFVHTRYLISVGKGAKRHINNYHLTKYAVYLILLFADSQKSQVIRILLFCKVPMRLNELHGTFPQL